MKSKKGATAPRPEGMNANAWGLYKALLSGELSFDMTQWFGEARCIGGYAGARMGRTIRLEERTTIQDVGDWLGIAQRIAATLIYPGGHNTVAASMDPWRFGRFRRRLLRADPYDATAAEGAQALARAVELSK